LTVKAVTVCIVLNSARFMTAPKLRPQATDRQPIKRALITGIAGSGGSYLAERYRPA